MYTFHYQHIFGDDFLVRSGTIHADSVEQARRVILSKFGLEDASVSDWTEKHIDGVLRYSVAVVSMNVSGERVEFWQESSLFDAN